MARHREGAVVYAAQDAQKAKEDFWLELDHRLLDKGLPPGSTSLSQFVAVQPQTIRSYRKGKIQMQVASFLHCSINTPPFLLLYQKQGILGSFLTSRKGAVS